MKLPRILTGDTATFTFISSGDTPSPITLAIIDKDDTVVSSVAMTDSGNGHYYANAYVNTPGFYTAEWKATIGGNPYRRREPFQAVMLEVD
jgi:hypothetical protein